MARIAQRRVTITDANSDTHTFDPGDEVPDELAERINNDAVWDPEAVDEAPLGPSDGEPDPFSGVQDAPYARAPEGDGVVTPYGGATPESLSGRMPAETPDDASSPDVQDDGSSVTPEQLDRMNRSELDEVALSRGLDPNEYATKADLRSAIDSAGVPGEGS